MKTKSEVRFVLSVVRRSGFGLGVFLCAVSAIAATPDQALKSVFDDPRLKLHDQAVSSIHNSSFLNPISETELRIDKGDFEKDEIKFGLRFHTRGLREYGLAKTYVRSMEESEKILREERLETLLSSRYRLISRAAQIKKKANLVTDLRRTIERASRAMDFAARRNRSELKGAFGIRGDIEKLQILTSQIERDSAEVDQELKRLGLGGLNEFEIESLAAPDVIGKRLGDIAASTEPALLARVALAQRRRAESALSFERAKKAKWLSYVQFSYAEEKAEKTYGVELGLLLPFLSGADPDALDKASKSLRDQADAIQTEREAQALADATLRELKSMLALYESLSKAQGSMDRDKVKKLSQSVAGQDPFLALELEKSWLEGRLALLDLEARVRELYVGHLSSLSLLSREPGVNHLAKTSSRGE